MESPGFDRNGVEERLDALWKVVTEMVEQFNIYRHSFKRLRARLDRLQAEMLEAMSEVHGRIDKLTHRHGDGDDFPEMLPEDTDKSEMPGFLDTMD